MLLKKPKETGELMTLARSMPRMLEFNISQGCNNIYLFLSTKYIF